MADHDGPALVGLARSEQGTKPLVVRGLDPADGTAQNLGIELPPTVGGTGAIGARWDLAHGRLLIVAPAEGATSGVVQYWLVQLQATQ
jgi:hypothetical protein